MEEKRWFTAAARGRARIFLAGALENRVLTIAFILAAGAALHFAITVEPAFAEQSPAVSDSSQSGNSYYRSMSESMSVIASHGSGANSPVSHYRTMTESMSVTTLQGKAPNSYARSMSEQASVTSGMPPSSPPSQPARAAPAPYSASSNQRIDERFSFRNIGGKTEQAYRSTGAGTAIYSADSVMSSSQLSGSGAGVIVQDTASVDGGSEDAADDHSLLGQLDAFSEYMLMQESMQNAAMMNASLSAVFLIGTAAVVVVRQPVIANGRLRKRMYAVFLLKHGIASEKDDILQTSNASTTRVLLLVVIIFAVPPIAFSTMPSLAQEEIDSPSKAILEILSASHLDQGREPIGDITQESRKLDGIWSEEISDGQYVRATFEDDLTSARDITVRARVVSGEPIIEVYEKGGDEKVAEFASLVSNENNKVYLTNLQGSQDTFDLRVVGGSVEFDHIVDPWPIPTFVGAGSFDAGTGGGVTPPLPAGIQSGDILLLFVETSNQAVTVDTPNGGTWTQIADSPQGTTGTRLTAFWSRYNGSQGNPSLSDSGDHNLAVILAFRGVISTGNPWDVTSGNIDATSDTTLSATGDTTTVANTLVVVAAALDDDADNFGATWTNANLANIAVRTDVDSGSGNDGALGIITGEKATAGAYGATTNTLSAGGGSRKGMMTIALKPPVPVAPTLSISQPDGTGDTVTRGDPYNITYTLSDPDDATIAAFFFDTNNSGLDGSAISGACATAAEGTGVTCQWDTTSMTPGSYYVYGIANDGTNPAVSAYSPGQITINAVINSRNLSEQLAAADVVARLTMQAVTLTEQMDVVGSIQTQSPNGASRSMTEQAGMSESIIPVQVLSRSMAEQMAAADSIVAIRSLSASMTDQAGILDSIGFDHIVNPIPSYVGAGALAESDGPDITPALPSGATTGDILLLFIETADQVVTISNPNGGTWTEVADSPQGIQPGTAATATRLTVFWSRHDGSQGDPTIAGSGNHNLAVLLAFRGVISTGNPWDVTSGSTEGNDNSLSATGDTTTVANTLVVVAAGLADDNADFATWTNTDLTSVNEQVNNSTALGNGGRIGIMTGEKAAAGAYGATTNTLTAAAEKAMTTIALRPPAVPILSISQPDGTGDTVARGDPYNVTYTLSDDDDVTTAALYFDTNNSGLDGSAISGACATAAEGTGVTCQWDTTGMATGTYYVYGIADDGTNPAVSAYSPGQITINPAANPRGLTEQAGLADSIIAAQILSTSIAEQAGISDSISAIPVLNRSITEQAGISDSMALVQVLSRSMTEQAGISDSIIAAQILRSITEQAGISDSMALVQVLSRSMTEQLGLADSIVRTSSFFASIADQAAVSDNIQADVVTNVQVSMTEQVGISDSIGRSVGVSASIPTYVGAGAFAESDGLDITPALPSATQADDILLLFVETKNQDVTISNPNGGTWTEVADSPQSFDGTNAEDTRLTVFWSRHDGSQGDPTIAGSANHNLAVILAFRGVINTGNPVDVTSGNVEGSDTSLSTTGDTTTVANTLVVIAAALSVDTANFGNTWTNADLANVTERSNVSTALANTGRLGIATGEKAAAGAYGVTNNTLTAPAEKAMMTIALRPAINYLRSATEQAGISDSISTAQILSTSITEQAGILDSMALVQVLSRSITEQIAIDDIIVGVRSFSAPIADQAAVSDSIQADAVMNVQVSITEQANLQDRIHRTLNGYSAGTVYRSDTGEFGLDSVKYRQWDPTGSIWSPEVELPDTGSEIRDAKIAFSPISEMRVVVSHGADGTLNLFRCDAICIEEDSWTLVAADFADTYEDNADPNPDPTRPFRFFDIGFEQRSGELLIVYDRDVTEGNDIYYRTYNGATLSPVAGFNYINPSFVGDDESIPFIHIASKPNSDEMALVLSDYSNQDSYALIFDATTGLPSSSTKVTLTTSMGSTSIDGDPVGIAYEPGNARAVAFAANGADSMKYSVWSGSSWSSVSTVDPNAASGNDVKFMSVKANPSPTSDSIMVCQSDDLLDLSCAEMENGVLGTFSVRDASVDSGSTRVFDFVWGPAGTGGMLVWGTDPNVMNSEIWSGSSWVSPSTTAIAGSHAWIVGHEAASTSETAAAIFLTTNSNLDTGSLALSGSTLFSLGNATHTLEADTSVTEGIGIDWHYAGIRQPFRLPAEQMTMTDSVAARTTKFKTESMSITESITRAVTKPFAENLVLSETTSISVVKPLAEQLALAETIAAIPSKNIAENLGMTETAARSFAGTRSMIEQIAVSEGIAKAVSKTLAEQVGITDSVASSFAISRSVSDQLGITETISKSAAKAMSEQLGMTDVAARAAVLSRSTAEQIGVTDSITPSIAKLLSEQLGVADSPARSIAVSRAASEQLGVQDTIAKAVTMTMAEQLFMTDAAASSVALSMTVSEQLGVTDVLTKSVSVTMAEQVGLTDTAARSAIQSVVMTEQIVIVDTISKALAATLNEQLTVTDTINRTAAVSASLAEQAAMTDAMTASTAKALAETMAITENVTAVTTTSRTTTEQIGISDSISVAVAKTLSEQLLVTEAAARSAAQSASMLEQLALSEAISAKVTARSVAEAMSLTDALNIALSKSTAEQLAVAENLDRIVVATRSASDALAVTEAIAISISKAMAEQIGLTDEAARALELARAASEQMAIVEAVTKSFAVTLSEEMGVTEQVAATSVLTISLSDQLNVADSVTKAASYALSESLAVTDTTARAVSVSGSMAEQLVMTDALTIVVSVSIAEQIAMTDDLQRSAVMSKSMEEQLAATDSIAVSVAKLLTEQLTMNDTTARSVAVARAMSEQLGVQDTIAKAVTVTMEEQLATSDTIERSTSQLVSASEQLAMSDAIAIAISVSPEEQLAMTDALASSAVLSRTMSEQLSMTDAAAKNVSVEISEHMSLTDAAARSTVRSVPLTEQMGIVDTISKTFAVTLNEQMAAEDTLAEAATLTRTEDESLAMDDAIAIAVSKSMTEQLGLADAVNRSAAQSTTLAEQMGITEAMSISMHKSMSDSLGITDTVARLIAQQASFTEQMTMTDQISISVSKTLSEEMLLTDSLAGASDASRTVSGQLAMTDAITMAVSISLDEQMVMTDDLQRSGAPSASPTDQLGVSDSISVAVAKTMAETMAVTDVANKAEARSRSISEVMSLTDAVSTSLPLEMTEQLAMTDGIAIAVAISVADQMAATDSAAGSTADEASFTEQLGATESVAISVSKQITDGLAISDVIMSAGANSITESLTLADSIARSVLIARQISDSMAIVDSSSGAPAIIVAIAESLAIQDNFAIDSIVFNLNLVQTLVLAQGFATNFSGEFSHADGEGIVIGDSVVLVLDSTTSPSESMALQDQVSTIKALGRGMSESMQASDSALMLVLRPPPPAPPAVDTMPDIVITETENVDEFEGLTDPMEAVPIDGEWDVSGLDEEGLEELLDSMNMTTYDLSLEADSDDVEDLTMVLPTFWVSMGDEGQDDVAFLTPVLSDLPAGMEVIVPINVEGSMDGDESLDLLGNMTVTFTTKENSTDFAMLITVLDENPEDDVSDNPPDDLPAFYIDVTVIGNFAGAVPGSAGFFEDPPQLTFTLTEEWADERGVDRDSNGVPIIGLLLLDEGDGTWTELTSEVNSPTSAVGGTYTFTATLPHFSTYVITAGEVGDDGGSSGGASSDKFARSLSESMFITGAAGIPVPSEGKNVIKEITDSLALSMLQQKPLHQRVIAIQNVTVAVSLADVTAAGVGTAVATLDFEITNRNGTEETLALRYWYADPATGERIYEGEQQVTVGPGSSTTKSVRVPFYSPSEFDLRIEAESAGGTLASTDIAVSVPWLAIYLYVLVAVAAVIVAVSAFYVLFAMRRRRSPDEE